MRTKRRTNHYVTAPDGSTAYVTMDGDMVDKIARDFYGLHTGATEKVLEANVWLSARGPVLAAGLVIKLPAATTMVTAKPFKRLWD